MGVLAAFVPDSQPAYFGGGVNIEVTEARTWRLPPFELQINGVAQTLTSVSGTCTVWDAQTNTSLTTLTVTVGATQVTVSKDETATGSLAGGQLKRRCRWSLVLTDTVDEIEVWGPDNSFFFIKSAVAV